MTIIVGLGNPGSAYKHTKHNVGFQLVDRLAEKLQLSWEHKSKFEAEIARSKDVLLIKPQTFMNRSGQAVQAVLQFFNVSADDLYVVHDDLDIAVGSYKIQKGTGPKKHNGLLSLYDHLHTKDVWHVRIGVDGRAGLRNIPPDQYVLSPFLPEEKSALETVLAAVETELLQLL